MLLKLKERYLTVKLDMRSRSFVRNPHLCIDVGLISLQMIE